MDNGNDLMQGIDLDSKMKATVRQCHEAFLKVKADDLQRLIPEDLKRAMAQAREKGGSSTLTTLPAAGHGFFFNAKADSHDHIHLRYCWPLDNLLPFVHVEMNTLGAMPKSANRLVSSTYGIMIQPTSWHHASKKFTTMSRLSQSCNH